MEYKSTVMRRRSQRFFRKSSILISGLWIPRPLHAFPVVVIIVTNFDQDSSQLSDLSDALMRRLCSLT